MVLEPVRQEYLRNYKELKQASTSTITLPEKVTEALKITEDIFGKCTEEEFNQLNN